MVFFRSYKLSISQFFSLSSRSSRSSIVIISFGNSSLTFDKFESHDEKDDFAFENVVVTAVTVFLALGVLLIDLKRFNFKHF